MQLPFGRHFDPPSRPSGVLPSRGPTRSPGVHAEAGLTIVVAATRRARLRGLARRDALPRAHALLLERCRCVHTFGMRFALDLLWLDRAGSPLRLDRAIAPRRLRGCLRARSVIECNAGEGERFADALRGAAPGRDGTRVGVRRHG